MDSELVVAAWVTRNGCVSLTVIMVNLVIMFINQEVSCHQARTCDGNIFYRPWLPFFCIMGSNCFSSNTKVINTFVIWKVIICNNIKVVGSLIRTKVRRYVWRIIIRLQRPDTTVELGCGVLACGWYVVWAGRPFLSGRHSRCADARPDTLLTANTKRKPWLLYLRIYFISRIFAFEGTLVIN